jgi:hypothetical protein
VGKAARRKRHADGPKAARTPLARVEDPREQANAALTRLVRTNRPGRLSLAGAYALGYAALGMAQQEGDAPDWYDDLDPLDTLVLGTVWPEQFRDGYEFGNARTAWLRLLRATPHWGGIERFVTVALAASDDHDLPIDDGELMLLLAARLEDAGLDQRALPAALLPGHALATSRVATGPDPDLLLAPPPPDAAQRVARFWDSTAIDLPHDGTAVDALREGMHLLATAGLPVHDEVVMLLPALYVALAAREDEHLDDAGERSEAWAWGLAEDSPLIPIVDVMLAAAHRDLGVDTTLGHLFATATFTARVPAADRRFNADPGTALTALAFELGHRQVVRRDRKTIPLDQGGADMIQAQVRAFTKKFGRLPGPGEPIFFDPDANEPRPVNPADLEHHTTAMLQTAGVGGAWIYAYQHTGGLLPRPDGQFNSAADQRDWNQHIDRYLRTHPGETVDHNLELAKLRSMLALVSIATAARDPSHGASLAHRLDDLDRLRVPNTTEQCV